MSIVTFFFAGTGHGIDHDLDDDSLVKTYNKTKGKKAFFPGPGGSPNIYASGFDMQALRAHFGNVQGPESESRGSLIGYNARIREIGSKRKRQLGGKGWDRNVWYALNLIATELINESQLTLNLVGHSRGSITIIMLLNDMFYEHTGMHKLLNENTVMNKPDSSRGNNKFVFKEGPVRAEWTPTSKQGDFGKWYLKQIEAVWQRRMGLNASTGGKLAKRGIEALMTIKKHQKNFDAINAWLYDPVAGFCEGASSRKQEFPYHPSIKRVRVLRMEQGGSCGGLSTHMPIFKDWTFLDGSKPRDLSVFSESERMVIPLPGSHGSGLSKNINKKDLKPTTLPQWYIGTSYMVGLLQACGSEFEEGYAQEWNNREIMLKHYYSLYEKFVGENPERRTLLGQSRAKIHTHHTKKDGYLGNAVNGHHRYLKDNIRL